MTASATAARRSERALPTVAVLTVTRDEGSMLRRWVRYYGDAVGRDHLLVLDNGSCDGSTIGLGCPVIPVPTLGGHRFERTRMQLVNGFAAGLLACHDFVIFVDVDEFLVPDPTKFAGLREFLAARRDSPVIAPVALNLVHHVSYEREFDPTKPVLEQRSFAKFAPLMCKPSIKQVPVPWCGASHGIGQRFAVDPDLFMLHLKFYDRDHVRSTGRKRSDVVALDGRARGSNWLRAHQLVHMLKEFVDGTDPQSVPEFDPRAVPLRGVVVHGQGGRYHTRRQGQIRAMHRMPLVRVPRRLIGTL